MRLIDAEAFENYVFDEWKKNEISNGDWIQFRKWLKDQETIVEFHDPITRVMVKGTEYLPVIRCNDCKHRDANNVFCEWRGWPMQLVPDDGFCDKGERREE